MISNCREETCFYGTFDHNLSTTATTASCPCRCDPGFTFDKIWFHSNSCTLPTNALLIYLVIYWVFSFCVLVALLNAIRKEKAKLKVFVQAMGGVSLIVWDFFVLAIYLDNGTFLAAVLINAVWLVITHIQGYSLWYSFASPIYAAQFRDEKHLRRKLKWITIGCCCFYVAYGIVGGALSALGYDDWFNLFTAIGFIIYVYIIFSASCIGILYHIEQLRWLCERVIQEHQQQQSFILAAALPSSSGTEPSGATISAASLKQLELFLKRSRRLKRAVWVFFALIALSSMPFPVAYFILGTLPFSWVFLIIMGFGPPTMCIGYTVFDRPERAPSISKMSLLTSKLENLTDLSHKSVANHL